MESHLRVVVLLRDDPQMTYRVVVLTHHEPQRKKTM